MGSYMRASDDNNATFQAMNSYFGENNLYEYVKRSHFLHYVSGVRLNLKV